MAQSKTVVTSKSTAKSTVVAGADVNVALVAPAPPTLLDFDYDNGASPVSGLIADAEGDLFGTTEAGGANGGGTVFELVNDGNGAITPTILVSFGTTGATGYEPTAGLVADAAGDLFGATFEGGANGDGAVFEIARTNGVYASTPTLLASFAGTNGAYPRATLSIDAAGDLFGTTAGGGASGDGTVFEIAKTGAHAHQITTLVSFNGTDGETPLAGVFVDASGNLFGTTSAGTLNSGANGDGTIFEIRDIAGTYATTPTTLASFATTYGGSTFAGAYSAGLIADAAGDLFGTTALGGATAQGVIFELENLGGGTYATNFLASFDGTDGANPSGGMILDARGDLFGVTSRGGDYGAGTVYELANSATGYASAPTTLFSFNESDGGFPEGGLVADASGDLFGTTSSGGTSDYGDGTAFELTNTGFALACYLRGTRIATPSGAVAIECLSIGDRVLTASGAARPVRWLGWRRLATACHPDPQAVWPVLVRAGAFGEATPSRDLWLSPGHNVVAEGVLMPIVALCNGRTVVRVRRPMVEYWHVELDSHDIILAEGLAAESYLDTGNRSAFANGGKRVDQFPDFAPKHWTQTCLPLVFDGPKVRRARAMLLRRAKAIGHALTDQAEPRLVADGRHYAPLRLGPARMAFVLPEGSADIVLRSRSFVPAQVRASASDARVLGICVARLQIDGADVGLDDEAVFAAGWHAVERGTEQPAHRWTTGCARLPAASRLVVIDMCGRGQYWDTSADGEAVLFG